MKKKRHAKILEIISKYEIETQEDLQNILKEHGFDVTQATISRDIRELKLIKHLSDDGKYVYAVRVVQPVNELELKAYSIFRDSIASVDYAINTVCIKCFTGMAGAACATIDALHWEGVLGTLAGDDTIFVLCRTEDYSKLFIEHLEKLLNAENA